MLVAIYKATGSHAILKWVDDFCVVCLPHQSWTKNDFIDLTASFGVQWSMKKTRPLATKQQYISFNWNLCAHSVAVPPKKLSQICSLLDQWLTQDTSFSAKEVASLHGMLVHISCVFPLIRPFLQSISRFAHHFKSCHARLQVTPLVADLSWVWMLIHALPNEVPLASPQPTDLQWWGDASTSFGIGIALDCYWVVWKWVPSFEVSPHKGFDIGWAEAVAVEPGLRIAIHLHLLDSADPARQVFLVQSENSGIVTITKKGHSQSKETNRTLKHIFLLQVLPQHHVWLKAIHVPSHINISDVLSQGDINGFLHSFPSITIQVSLPVPTHLSDKLVSL